jgi:phosphoesterase RecJ-like protein
MEEKIQLLHQHLLHAAKCAVIGHVNPDGDAMGAALALQRFLVENYPAVEVRAILPNRFPAYFGWMDMAGSILIYGEKKEETAAWLAQCGIVVCVDFNALYRLDELGGIISALPAIKILIDHHPNPAADFALQFSDPIACSTCEVLYGILAALQPCGIGVQIAESLFTGIFTDTGGFSYNVKRAQVLRIAADLMDKGIDKDAIAGRIFDSYSAHRMRLLGYALKDKMQIIEDKKTAYIALSQQELSEYHHETGDTEGFANMPLSIKDIVLSGLFYQSGDKSHIRVSLRTKGNEVSANAIAKEHFGGGGHFNAAGGKFFGTLQECCSYFENIVRGIVLMLLLGCACGNADLKPYKAEVSMEKVFLQQANVVWAKREADSIDAYISRHALDMERDERGFFRQIIKHGGGAFAAGGSVVRLWAQIYLLDGTFCYEYDHKNPMEVEVGRRALFSGLHAALDGLRQGDDVWFIFPSRMGFGLLGDRDCVPGQSPLLVKLKILGVE